MKAIKVLVVSVVLSLALAASALAAHPVRSLNDLPFKWEGTAGDLLSVAPATFTIERIVKVTHEGDGKELNAAYDVDANLRLGERSLSIAKVTLRSYSFAAGESIDLFMTTNDDHVYALNATIHYDETTDTYTLSEIPNAGVRRFVLKGVARK